MKNKILGFFNSVAIIVLFISLGMYDSENIILPALMTLISILLIMVFANREVEKNDIG